MPFLPQYLAFDLSGPPIATTEPAKGISASKATLHGTVDANNAATSYWFEYWKEGEEGKPAFAPLTKSGAAGEGSEPVAVSERIEGLQKNTIYFFRLVASNENGEATGESASFFSLWRAVAIVEERPSDKLAVVVRDQDGNPIGRWAEDESSIENVISGLTKDGEMPGGHKEMGCVLARDPKQSYPDLALFSRVEVQAAGGEIVWSGGLRQQPQSDGDHIAIEPKAVGDKQFLEDDEEIVGPGFIDGDMTKVGDPSAQRKADLAANFLFAANPSLGSAGSGEAPASVLLDFSNAQTVAGKQALGYGVYDSGGPAIAEVLYQLLVLAGSEGLAAWDTHVATAIDDRFTEGLAVGTDHNATDATGSLAAGAGSRHAEIVSLYNDPAPPTNMSDLHGWILKVIGDHGLALHGTWPNVGFLAQQMIPFIAELAGLTTKEELLEDDGFVIPQAWFSAPGTPMSKLVEVTKYGLLDWFVFEHKILQYRFPGTYGRRWRLASGSSAPKNSGPDANRVWDRLMVSWQDVDGTTKTAGPPESGAMFEDSRLQLTDSRNAAVSAGRPRGKLLALNGLNVESTAIGTGIRFLEEAAQLDQSGEATISGYAQTDERVWLPASYVQPGDEVADPGTQNYRKVTGPAYAHDSKTVRMSIGAPPEGQEALEARFNAKLIELGVGA